MRFLNRDVHDHLICVYNLYVALCSHLVLKLSCLCLFCDSLLGILDFLHSRYVMYAVSVYLDIQNGGCYLMFILLKVTLLGSAPPPPPHTHTHTFEMVRGPC